MLNEVHRQKIQYFNSIVNNSNENVAINYLNQANWNEVKAVQLFYDNASLSNSMSQNIRQPSNPSNNFKYVKAMKECQFYNDNNTGLFSQAFSFIKTTLGIKNNNSQICDNLNGIVNGLVKGTDEFLTKLRDKKGIIILYTPENYQELIDNILLINQEYMFDTIIFPIINNSDEGENLIQQLNINKFPSFIFCKYKNERIFYVTDIIQKKLNINQFKNCLSQLAQINNNNNHVNNINQPRYNINNNWQYNNQYNDDRININNRNNYEYLNNSGIQPNSQNYPNNINNKNQKNYPQSEIKLNTSQNNSNSNNINKKKEYIPDIRDYDLDGSLSFSYLNQSHNNNNNFNYGLNNNNNNLNNNSINKNNNSNFNNNYNINNSNNNINNSNRNINNNSINLNNNNNFNNSNNNINISDSFQNIPITDSFIRRKQDDEMKKLEEMEEEKERKEKEEEEKKRIEEEKEKEKLKTEKEEKELFSQLIPPEPDDNNPDKCVIIFRLPDGQKNIQRKFLKTNKISLLYDYIKSLGREIYSEEQYNNFSIIQTFPFKNFEDKLNNTLEEEGLYPNSVLQIKESN